MGGLALYATIINQHKLQLVCNRLMVPTQLTLCSLQFFLLLIFNAWLSFFFYRKGWKNLRENVFQFFFLSLLRKTEICFNKTSQKPFIQESSLKIFHIYYGVRFLYISVRSAFCLLHACNAFHLLFAMLLYPFHLGKSFSLSQISFLMHCLPFFICAPSNHIWNIIRIENIRHLHEEKQLPFNIINY